MRSRTRLALLASAITLFATTAPAAAHGPTAATPTPHELQTVHASTARYHNIAVARADGYAELTDAAGIACIDNPGVGAMGIHYVKGPLVGDPAIDALRPEVLVYEPGPNGTLHLVAAEYVVFQSAWDATHTTPPSLFGEEFALVPAGNRYGLPAFYELHAWVWKHNPRGTFDDWNPRVSCTPKHLR